MPDGEIRTERLRLRRWQAGDLVPFAAMNADPAVMKFFPASLSRSESDDLVRRLEHGFQAQGFGFWVIELVATGEFLGFAGLSRVTFPAHFTPAVEIGWRLAADRWGRGYATEAAAAALAYGFGVVGLNEIVSFTAEGNRRSQRVMQRLGMRHDPAGDFDHPRLPEGHELRKHVLYRLAVDDWSARLSQQPRIKDF